MRRDLPFDEIADVFRLAAPAVAEKDYFVTQALFAISQVHTPPFTLVFGGGTSLSKAHDITKRMSEDIDLRIVMPSDSGLSGNPLKRALRDLRGTVCDALLQQGFEFDPADRRQIEVGDQNRFARFNLPYPTAYEEEGQLRPEIKIETNLHLLRTEPVVLPVASFAAQALKEPPEISGIPCVAISETAADKLVALLWRVFSKSINEGPASNADDARLVRHVYDLHMLVEHLEISDLVGLAREISGQDAHERRGQAPTFAAAPEQSLLRAVDILSEDGDYARQYRDFIGAMVYGEKPPYEDALSTVESLARQTWAPYPER